MDVFNREVSATLFHGTHISSVKPSEFCQTFLGQTPILTNLANCLAQRVQEKSHGIVSRTGTLTIGLQTLSHAPRTDLCN